MAEYIEREAMLHKMKMDIRPPFAVARDFPAADVAPVRHGRFVHDGPRFDGAVDWWHCSSCGGLVSGVETRFDYCPYCGAKMDMEE